MAQTTRRPKLKLPPDPDALNEHRAENSGETHYSESYDYQVTLLITALIAASQRIKIQDNGHNSFTFTLIL